MNLSDVALWCVLGIICVGGVKVIGFEAAPPWLYNDSTLIYWNETLGNLTYLNASPNSFVVNEDADGQTDKLILRGHGGAAAARRSGQIAWEFDAAGNEVGHMFVSSQNELVFCNESQSSATDDCFDTYIDFDDGSLTVQGSPPLLSHQN